MKCREVNEESRNGRGQRRSKNCRKETEQFEICRRYNINGRKKADLTKLIRRLKRESEKAGLYFSIKKTKIMTTADWDSFEIDGEENRSSNKLYISGIRSQKRGKV